MQQSHCLFLFSTSKLSMSYPYLCQQDATLNILNGLWGSGWSSQIMLGSSFRKWERRDGCRNTPYSVPGYFSRSIRHWPANKKLSLSPSQPFLQGLSGGCSKVPVWGRQIESLSALPTAPGTRGAAVCLHEAGENCLLAITAIPVSLGSGKWEGKI